MGYTIRYGVDSSAEAAWKRKAGRKHRRFWGFAAILTAFVILTFLGFAGKLEWLLIPGDPEITKAAFSQFTENLRGGESVKDAMVAFCREIIDGAAVPG